jgi:hypothetical protein
MKLWRSFAIKGLEFHWSASGKVLKRPGAPIMKSNGLGMSIKFLEILIFFGLHGFDYVSG